MNDLIRETYETFMALRTGAATPDETRARLASLKARAGASWERVKFAAIAYDVKANS